MQNITRMQLHNKRMQLKSANVITELTDYVIEQLNIVDNTSNREIVTNILREQFTYKYQKRWRDSHRKNSYFLEKNEQWLAQTIYFPDELFAGPSGYDSSSKGGRPKKEFVDLTEGNKRRRTDDIHENTPADILIHAAARSLQKSGNVAAAKIIRMIAQATPTQANEMWKKLNFNEDSPSAVSPEEALALIMSSHFTRQQYLNVRQLCKTHGSTILPSHFGLRHVRKETYPENIEISDTKCMVSLQNLLNHTVQRLRLLLAPTIETQEKNFCLISKWGMDGSSGHSAYKQGWQSSDKNQSDESIFMTAMVPLKLVGTFSKKVYWENPRPSSSRFCRPISLQWTHETTQLIKEEEERMQMQINNLLPCISGDISVEFKMLLTMVDGKVCNALADTSSMRCYICKCSISEMNNLDNISTQFSEDPTSIKFGISPLHCRIRFLECVLHILYRLDFKKWKASLKKGETEEVSHKDLLERRKRRVQEDFKKKMGLLEDLPKQGYGTSNDGNTSRRAFENPKLFSEITGVNEELIHRFSNILTVLNSGLEINDVSFNNYCQETAKLNVDNYNWYYMPPSVHKVLIHGTNIVQAMLLPIGHLSEESMEAQNKYVKQFRRDQSQKRSRFHTNRDLFHRLLSTSDPVITNKNVPKSSISKLPNEVLQLLKSEDSSSEDEDNYEDEYGIWSEDC